MVKKYEGLLDAYMEAKLLGKDFSGCVDWAAGEAGKDGADDALATLAAVNRNDGKAIRQRVEELLGEGSAEDELWAGRRISESARRYFDGGEGAEGLAAEIAALHSGLGSPDWLSTLRRNAEFLDDIPAYRDPFEAELKYLARLWSHAGSAADFLGAYDYRISDKHELR